MAKEIQVGHLRNTGPFGPVSIPVVICGAPLVVSGFGFPLDAL